MSIIQSKFQGLGARFKKPVVGAAAAVSAHVGAPVFLMMGSLTGCTYKDALAYARGLAETYVVAPPLGRFRVQEDKANRRFVYEIQEGGPGLSIIDGALAELAAGNTVRINLAGGGSASVEEAQGEVISLIYPPVQEAELQGLMLPSGAPVQENAVDIATYCSTVKLAELFPESRQLINLGGIALGVAASLFMLTGASYTVKQSGLFDADAMLTLTKAGYLSEASDNPVWQLEKARAAADKESKVLSALKKSPKGWSWELTQ